jgi:hypothetical protein
MNEKMNELIRAIGLLAEMMWLLRGELLKNGFTREETLYLVAEYMKDQLNPKNTKNQEEI